MAFSKQQRLSKKKDIERVLADGRKQSGSFFRLFFYFNNLPYSRYAFIISKKVSQKATERNRLRRRIGSWIAAHGNFRPPRDIVFIVYPQARVLSRKKLYEELERVFHRLHTAVSKNSVSRS